MRMQLLVLGVLLSVLCGCGITVVPRPDSADAVVNPADKSITESRKNLQVSARVQDLTVGAYLPSENITSFYVAIVNQRQQEVRIPLDAFILFDQQGNQIRPLQPAAVLSMMSRQADYLVPYPYVGFYYLQNAQESTAINTMSSSLPYYDSNHPQDILAEALPISPILPGARIGGMLYFPVDLATKKSVVLKVYLPGTATSGPADFAFPFSIEN